jgi:RNA polymerase sigma factor (sigma-70 family)
MADDWPMSDLSDLLVRELPLIERITTVICRRHGMDSDAIEEFSAEVRLRLVKDDYAVLRAFGGRSKFNTYIAAVIRRMLIDHRRHNWGKWHDSAEAGRLGDLGVDVERALHRDGRTAQDAAEQLRKKYPGISPEEIERIATLLPPRIPRRRVGMEEASSIEAASDADRVIHMETAARISAVVCTFIDGLPGDDQLIFRLRFDCEMTVAQIARSLHRDQQVLYRLLYRHFGGLRDALTAAGVDAQAVEALIGSDSIPLDFQLKNRSVRPSREDESEVADRREEPSS